jgi:hypothetical protein
MYRICTCTAVAAVLMAVSLSAQAQSFRCVGKDGKKYYGQTIPRQCLGVQVEQLSAQGIVVKRIDPPSSPEERAQKAAEEKAAKELAEQKKEDSRRARALLATYSSENDIDAARARALAENRNAMKEIDDRIAQIKKRQQALADEMEFYKGRNKPPAKLVQDVRSAEIDYKAQSDLQAVKQKEVESINARFDDDKRRFQELTTGAAASSKR